MIIRCSPVNRMFDFTFCIQQFNLQLLPGSDILQPIFIVEMTGLWSDDTLPLDYSWPSFVWNGNVLLSLFMSYKTKYNQLTDNWYCFIHRSLLDKNLSVAVQFLTLGKRLLLYLLSFQQNISMAILLPAATKEERTNWRQADLPSSFFNRLLYLFHLPHLNQPTHHSALQVPRKNVKWREILRAFSSA